MFAIIRSHGCCILIRRIQPITTFNYDKINTQIYAYYTFYYYYNRLNNVTVIISLHRRNFALLKEVREKGSLYSC